MTQDERETRLKEIAREAEKLQAGKEAVVSSDDIATQISRRRPDLRHSEPWSLFLEVVRQAIRRYGDKLTTGYMVPPISEPRRKAIVAEVLRGGKPESIGEGGGVVLSLDEVPVGGRVGAARAHDIATELEAVMQGKQPESSPAELAAGFVAAGRAKMDEDRRKQVVAEACRTFGIR